MNDQVEALKAKREALEARREADRAANAEATELAREKLMLANLEALDKAEAEHGRENVTAVDTPEGVIIVKRPAQATYRKFVDTGKSDTETLDKLAAPCVVHPEKIEYRRLLDVYPHVVVLCANAVVRLAGMRDAKKE